ncbi:formate dehydrogenase accessory sulfurtransferase FdhD [Rhodococcus sp. NPDC058521]|uniref:formate dehydrogenase accessory sulfurtransferase FdhD n=1 Tax=Rhodococcus sp. NPDC058521 TaxID=3346536 RepID=UPI0036578D06
MGRITARRPIVRVTATGSSARPDSLAVEEPFEMRVGGRPLSVTMRTPGADIDLVHGSLYTEGIIRDRSDITEVRYCDGVDENGTNTYNVVDVHLPDGSHLPEARSRRTFVNSACGVCGKTSADEIRQKLPFPPPATDLSVCTTTLAEMPVTLRRGQRAFDSTGGLHAAALFTADGALLALREDVGRHNAVDKVLGWAVREGLPPLSDKVLLVTSRASFEIVQKAAMAGVRVLATVSAPSSLAVDLANECDLTLVGFLRGDSMNVYTHAERMKIDSGQS